MPLAHQDIAKENRSNTLLFAVSQLPAKIFRLYSCHCLFLLVLLLEVKVFPNAFYDLDFGSGRFLILNNERNSLFT